VSLKIAFIFKVKVLLRHKVPSRARAASSVCPAVRTGTTSYPCTSASAARKQNHLVLMVGKLKDKTAL